MRDEQVRRYARHILLPDVGGLGQTAMLVAVARVDIGDPAGLIAATYLSAGGVGTVVVDHAGDAQLAALTAINPDVTITRDATEARPDVVTTLPVPDWWPESDDDDTARAFWRGGLAATQCMARIISR